MRQLQGDLILRQVSSALERSGIAPACWSWKSPKA